MTDWRIAEGGLDDARVIALVEHHVRSAGAALPPGAGHAFEPERLKLPGVRFFTAWLGDSAAGVGALKGISFSEGEVKSMFTADAARGQGIGAAILARVIEAAREAGLRRLSLETHPGNYFAAARALYGRYGFTECQPYADYRLDPASIYMTREI